MGAITKHLDKAKNGFGRYRPFHFFEAYESKFIQEISDGQNVFWQYNERIKQFRNPQ